MRIDKYKNYFIRRSRTWQKKREERRLLNIVDNFYSYETHKNALYLLLIIFKMKLYIREESLPLIVQKLDELYSRYCLTLLHPSERKLFIRVVELLSIRKHILSEFIRIAEREMGDKFIDFYEPDTEDKVHKKTNANGGTR